MENDQPISRDKVIREFDRRAKFHGNLNAVLDAGDKPGVRRQNILRDYITRRRLISLLKPGHRDTILDFGCGMGRLTNYIKHRASKICGIDASEAMIELALKQNEENSATEFKLISNNNIPYPGEYFNKAFTVWVLQHIDDNELNIIAGELYRVLTPGGVVVLLEQTREKKAVLSDIHIHRSFTDYHKIFEEAGFTVTLSKPAMRVPSYAMSLWSRYSFLPLFILPVLNYVELLTLNFRPVHIEYYTWSFVFTKKIKANGN